MKPKNKLSSLCCLILSGCAAQYEVYEPVSVLPPVYNQDQISRYLLTHYKGVGNEQARVIYFRDNTYLSDEIAATGSHNTVAANGLQIVINCTIKHCNRVVLAHNHPDQYWARASGIDLENSDKFQAMMNQAQIKPSYVILGEADANWVF
jgi:DNA repair protein RadC